MDILFIQSNISSLVKQYRDIYEWLLSKQDENGVSKTAPTDIASNLGLSETTVLKRIRKLTELGLIERIDNTGYSILFADFTFTPLSRIEDLLSVIEAMPHLSYSEQAEKLEISMQELEAIYGYMAYIAG